MERSKPDGGLLPVLSLLLAAAMWGTVWYPLRLLEQHGLDGTWSALSSYAAALLVGGWLLIGRTGELRRQPLVLVCMALASGWTNVAFILAMLEGTVMRVLLLFYLSPIWALALAWLLLGERPDRRALGVFATAVVGALTMLWDPRLGVPWPRGGADWLAASAGFAFALTNVLVRRLQQVSVPAKTVFAWGGVLVVAGAMAALTGTPPPPVSAGVWGGAALLGVLGFVIMTLSVQYGVTRMPIHRSAVILLFELVAGAVSSLTLTDEVVLPREWTGGALIVIAAWLAARVEEEAQ